MKKVICIIGGDERNKELGNILKEDFSVKIYDENFSNTEEFLKGADCVIGGIPFSRDGEYINVSDIAEKISVKELFSHMKDCKKLIAGSFSDKVKETAREYNIELYDFLDDEDFTVYNAIPTAEGALEIAMRETEKTINGSKCIVLGFGRIGKITADILNGLHAEVTVTARKDRDIAWITALGYEYVKYSELKEILPNTDIIFNTVPSPILGKEELKYMKKESLIIDLASKPGGVDFDYARETGIKTLHALGLPGKVAPKSVAEYMLNKVMKVI